MHKKLLLALIVCVVVDLAICQNQSANTSTEGLFFHLERIGSKIVFSGFHKNIEQVTNE